MWKFSKTGIFADLRNAIGWYITFAKKVDWANLNSDVYKLDLINCKM